MSDASLRPGLFARLKAGLARSASALSGAIAGALGSGRLDQATLDQLEEGLIAADLGVPTASALIAELKAERFGKEASVDDVRGALSGKIAARLAPLARPLAPDAARKPHVILVAGVNGTGKTTTIGKLAARYRSEGRRVVLAAADTFRAAAIEQLRIWSARAGAALVAGAVGADPAGVAFEALTRATAEGADVLIVDTAGRLQNKAVLMDELAKIVRVLKRLEPSAPHDVVLVLDATTGQNAIGQVEVFSSVAAVSGLIMTKLDGTARGGVLVAIAEKFKLPIHAIGVGEAIEDLQPFEADAFARALTGAENG
ncbi:MAG: signal recognition particle-docking protein FtsY [Alphaproteobacteria bacterium]|nr:signal recognition particle-docking protein FtsY [Alphaproteobacteria bacterium]